MKVSDCRFRHISRLLDTFALLQSVLLDISTEHCVHHDSHAISARIDFRASQPRHMFLTLNSSVTKRTGMLTFHSFSHIVTIEKLSDRVILNIPASELERSDCTFLRLIGIHLICCVYRKCLFHFMASPPMASASDGR
jgi:hypothetical protein